MAGGPRAPGRSRWAARAEVRAAARAESRARLLKPVQYPEDLPISAKREELLAALAAHQVLIVAGETGSGKSTQLPKLCLEAGRGAAGIIGHTQPRRIAARSVAERVADELGVELGGPVGYKVRFTDKVGDGTLVKLMTDGVLLAELAGDRALAAYDTLIIDEAHERSLNIDFLLGYLALLLLSRPDLKLVVTSATIDTEAFSRHFGGAPVVEVEGRAYPVEIRYRPVGTGEQDGTARAAPESGSTGEPASASAQASAGAPASASAPASAGEPDDTGEADEVQAVCDAVAELSREGPGDILVFLAGEAEIRDTAEALAKTAPGLEILPLYGRLSSAEQHRIFEAHAGRRVVLATNVAETSITVPGIRYVVDVGTARISRYGRRTKVQRLPIERISRASADQRAGRCGRLGPGICLRLYSEEDYLARRRFTEPEVLRTNLASVVLQMAAIGLGDIEGFPFVDPPERRNIRDGLAVLEELGALRREKAGKEAPEGVGWELTPVGRKIARLPLDPRLGRIVLEGARLGCLAEVLVIVAGLAVQDPRERPAAKRSEADALHRRFDDQSSDFLSYLALWDYLGGRRGELSSGQFRRLCQRELISYQRAREWQDVHAELLGICHEVGLSKSTPPVPESHLGARERALVHQALLSGLVTHVGKREAERTDFAGTRGARFTLWPASVLAKKPPRWVMAAELVETRRLWARVAAPVKPEWVERAAAHLLDWSYSEPFWDPRRAEAVVLARGTLYGLPVVPGRHVALARLGPAEAADARETFVERALVEGEWEAAPDFVSRNAEMVAGLMAAAQKARRAALAPGRAELYAFYDRRAPGSAYSGRTFEAWWRRQGPGARRAFEATPEDLGAPPEAESDRAEGFPDAWPAGDGARLAVEYDWDAEGVTVEVPLARLPELRDELEWQVPGLREELVEALLRSLRKELRRELAPIGERAKKFVAEHGPGDGPLAVVLARSMSEASGVALRPEDFDWAKVPSYLRPLLRVVGGGGEVLAGGKDPAELMEKLRPQFASALAEAASSSALEWGPAGKRAATWDFGTLPKVFEAEWQGQRLRGFPALVDEGQEVRVAVFADEASQQVAMASGARRLLLLGLPARRHLVTTLERLVDNRTKLALGTLGPLAYSSPRELAEDLVVAALDEVIAENGGPPSDAQHFEALLEAARRDAECLARQGLSRAVPIISQLQRLRVRTEQLDGRALSQNARDQGPRSSAFALALADAKAQLAVLGVRRFASRQGLARLPDLERYLTALERRMERLPSDPLRDWRLAEKAQVLEHKFDKSLEDAHRRGKEHEFEDLRWALAELRVSLFAQSLGTKFPVSEARLARALAERRQAAGIE